MHPVIRLTYPRSVIAPVVALQYAKDAPVVNVWDVNHWVGQQVGTAACGIGCVRCP